MSESVPEIGNEQIDAILGYLPHFEQSSFKFGEWGTREGQMPFFSFGDEAAKFVSALYRHGLIIPFEWRGWKEEAKQYQIDSEALATADLLTILKLFTLHVRTDRFAEGHLAQVYEKGHLTAILQRLKQLRDEQVGNG